MVNQSVIVEAFEVFQERDTFMEKISENLYKPTVLWGQIALIFMCTLIYGLIMGSYNGVYQSLLSGFKLFGLFFLTILICFPSFYIVQIVLGSKIRMNQLLIMLLSGLVMVTTIMVAFSPIVLFFQLSGGNYHFIRLLHIAIFIFSGIFGMRIVLESLKNACENQHVYPKIGLDVFKFWTIIFAFVGLQLSRTLRPFIGHKDMPFQIFRQNSDGNVYGAIFRSMGEMLGIPKPKRNKSSEAVPQQENDTLPLTPDTTSLRKNHQETDILFTAEFLDKSEFAHG